MEGFIRIAAHSARGIGMFRGEGSSLGVQIAQIKSGLVDKAPIAETDIFTSSQELIPLFNVGHTLHCHALAFVLEELCNAVITDGLLRFFFF